MISWVCIWLSVTPFEGHYSFDAEAGVIERTGMCANIEIKACIQPATSPSAAILAPTSSHRPATPGQSFHPFLPLLAFSIPSRPMLTRTPTTILTIEPH